VAPVPVQPAPDLGPGRWRLAVDHQDDPALAALGAGHGHLDPVDLEDPGVGRLPAPTRKERAPVEDDTVLLDPGDLGIEGREVGVVLVQRLGHLTTLSRRTVNSQVIRA
jgi:hypothetical protein